jgi:hypothetical protein
MTRQRMRRRPGRAHSAAIAESSRAPLDIEQVAARAAEIVLARLSAGLAAELVAFSTHRDGPRPREYARRPRAWRQLAPQIPGLDSAEWKGRFPRYSRRDRLVSPLRFMESGY